MTCTNPIRIAVLWVVLFLSACSTHEVHSIWLEGFSPKITMNEITFQNYVKKDKFIEGDVGKFLKGFPMYIHSFETGKGDILSVNEYFYNRKPFSMHGSMYRRITIYVPESLRSKQKIKIGKNAYVVISFGNPYDLLENGCIGYAKNGEIEITASDQEINAKLDADFDLYSPLGWSDDCKNQNIKAEIHAFKF